MAKKTKLYGRLFPAVDFGKLKRADVAELRDGFRLASIKFEFTQHDGTGSHKVEFSNTNSLRFLRWLDDNGFCD